MNHKVTTLLFLRRNDEILLATKKRGFGEGYWNGAGGKIENGESVEQAMIRESQEEIGVTPTVYEKVAEHDFHMDTDTKQSWHMYVHAFVASEWTGEPAESEEMAPQWFKLSDIPYDQMWADDPFWLPQVIAGDKVTGVYAFDHQNKLLSHEVSVVDILPGLLPTSTTPSQPKFAVFDIDGTLIRWQLYHAVVSELATQGALSDSAAEKIRSARLAWKKRPDVDAFRTYELLMISVYHEALSGISTDAFTAATMKVFETYKDQVYVYTRELLKDLRAQGYLLFAISGSQHEIVEMLGRYYGFDAVIGAQYDQTPAGMMGGIISTPAEDGKASHLQNLVTQYNATYEGSYAIGDSLSDAQMLALVEHPIAFNPDRNLFQEAQKEHWKIVIERKNMIYELESKDGKYFLA